MFTPRISNCDKVALALIDVGMLGFMKFMYVFINVLPHVSPSFLFPFGVDANALSNYKL